MVSPDLEVVKLGQDECFKVWSHGLPFRTVRWHFHPEYELHLIVETSGRAFVGDYTGAFQPGNLVLTGPTLPHNWISDVPGGTIVQQRCLVLQFGAAFIDGCLATFPELRDLGQLLREAARGVEFGPATAAAAKPILFELHDAQGPRRIVLFIELLDLLAGCRLRRALASAGYLPDPLGYMSKPLNHVLAHITRNFDGDLREGEMAELSGYSASAFSRAFKRHTGITFVRYVTQLRVNRACDLLTSGEQRVTDICFEVGFSNVSNFNRHFLALKRMPPSEFRSQHRCLAARA